jgi:hypothetical protein
MRYVILKNGNEVERGNVTPDGTAYEVELPSILRTDDGISEELTPGEQFAAIMFHNSRIESD